MIDKPVSKYRPHNLNGGRPNTHGAGGAERAITRNEPFRGLAAEAERRIEAELEGRGRAQMVIRAAIRLETAATLYWDALKAAADGQEIKDLDKFAKRFGWLQSAALRAWAEVRAEEKISPDDIITVAIEAAKEARVDEHSESD